VRFLPFVWKVWPGHIYGRHHEQLADAFERINQRELKRVIINMPPRSTKSKFASVHFPACIWDTIRITKFSRVRTPPRTRSTSEENCAI